jgi:hypothetical protein
MNPIDLVEPLLTNARQTTTGKNGEKRWQFSCSGPNHKNGDAHPSAVMSECEDGKLLFYCAGGCNFYDIINGFGLKPADAFPKGISDRVVIDNGVRLSYREALSILKTEVWVVLIAATTIQSAPLSQSDLARLYEAIKRIRNTIALSGLKL